MHILLFDIDGTLLHSGGAGQNAIERTLADSFGMTKPVDGIPTAGRTDRGITRDLFQFYDIEVTDENWERFRDTYTGHLETSLRELDGDVLPGIRPLLDELQQRENVTLGLLTGNFRDGAWIKLRHFELDHHFEFGGFGDDHAERDDIAREVYRSLEKEHGSDIEPDRIWVIGDTPHDVQCGRAIGARVVAVGTGVFAMEELAASQPDHLFEDFSDYQRLLDMII